MKNNYALASAVIAGLALTACGGGGGSSHHSSDSVSDFGYRITSIETSYQYESVPDL
ncbi:MAG: hypothetical protein IJ523_09325 [Succinivibrionaceae bacterium]|nr:hypothetical protein [Succinivibrionaceae bacterium]